jgi:hypothetical protein
MAVDQTIATAMESTVVSMGQGHAFVMEQGRLGMLEGKMGIRETIAHRVIAEAGGGQARAQLPGGQGGVPTVTGS